MKKELKDAIKRIEARLQEYTEFTCTTEFAGFVDDIHTLIKHAKGAKK